MCIRDSHGMIYNNCVKLGLNNPEMARFVEMCFDPGSAMNERLKATLVPVSYTHLKNQISGPVAQPGRAYGSHP